MHTIQRELVLNHFSKAMDNAICWARKLLVRAVVVGVVVVLVVGSETVVEQFQCTQGSGWHRISILP